jgi:hypothetical protein
MKRQTRAPSARLFFVDEPDGGPADAPTTPAVRPTRRLADAEPPPSPPPPTPPQRPVAVAPAPAPVGVVAAPAPAPRQLPEAVPETTLGRFSLLQKQLQALDEAAANEKAQQASIKKQLREARAERDLRSTKAKSYRREAALAAVAAKRLELAMADEAYAQAEKARKEARVKLEVMDRDTVVATKEQFRATAKIREAERARKHDATLAEIAAETASVALQKLEVEHELAQLQLQKREADRNASLSTAALLEKELGDELREALVTSAGLAALPPEFPGDEKEAGLELAMASPSSVTTPRATTPARDLDPEEDAEHCIASFDERVEALEKEAASAMQEVAWASNALRGLEDIASVQDEALDAAAQARAQKKDMEKLERREAETYGVDGVGAWDPVRGALIKVVRGVVLELGREFITDLIGEVAHSMKDECDKARSLIVDALTGLVDGSDLRTLERARTELLMRNMNNERAVPTRAARRLASIEPTLLFLPGLDGSMPRPLLKMDAPPLPRPRLLELGEPISTVCCSRGVTVTDDESSTVFVAVGGRRGGIAIGSVAHRPNPRYIDEDDDDEVVACLKDTIYPTTNSQVVALCIGRRRRRLCAVDASGLIRVWRFDLSPTLQIKQLQRETRLDAWTLRARCRALQAPAFARIDDDDELREAGWTSNVGRPTPARWRGGSTPSLVDVRTGSTARTRGSGGTTRRDCWSWTRMARVAGGSACRRRPSRPKRRAGSGKKRK